jgi:glycosidase
MPARIRCPSCWFTAVPLLYACAALQLVSCLAGEGLGGAASDAAAPTAGAATLAAAQGGPAGAGPAGTTLGAGSTAGTAADGNMPMRLRVAPADMAIYAIYTPIFSSAGTLNAIKPSLSRLADMGFTTLYLMPLMPQGKATGTHPAFGSPYCVADHFGIDPQLGSADDLKQLVAQAHAVGLQVIVDQVLNHTSWDNPLVVTHPEYYVHTDSNVHDPNTVAQAFSYGDVAQFDYKAEGTGLQAYVADMVAWWVQTYGIDGFRFDMADNPAGDNRMIPAAFWQTLARRLRTLDANVVLLGEQEDPALALAPFNLDYGWLLQTSLVQAAKGQGVARLASNWQQQKDGYPAQMLHVTLLQDWDLDLDLNVYGGTDGTLAAAAFNFTIDGVPMLFAGEEVGNERSGLNTHQRIDWDGPNAARFTPFYSALVSLPRGHAALRTGATQWLSAPSDAGVASFTRTGATEQFFVAINFSDSARTTRLSGPAAAGWREVTPPGAAHGVPHPTPPDVQLGPWDFAVFCRSLP